MSIRWGARIDGEVYGGGDAPWDATTWNTFEQHTDKKVSLLHWGQPFGALDLNACHLVRNRAATSLISIGLEGTTLSDIAAGKQDTKINDFAKQCYQFGGELLLRPWWEMNGAWYTWGRNPDYINAWRRFYMIVRNAAPATKLVWCVNTIWDSASGDLAKWYPGDEYCDWIGIDGYNRNEPWKSPSQVFDPTVKKLIDTIDSPIPFIICETGCTESGGDKAKWIRSFLTNWVPKHRRVQAFTYFNWNIAENFGKRRDWQIESSPAAQDAFRKAIANSYYQ